VKFFDQASAPLNVPVAGNPPPPDPFGPGVSAILNPDGSTNSSANPASTGAVVTLLIDNSQLPSMDAAPTAVTIGGIAAQFVPMTGDILGHAGKLQFQVRVPAGVQAGSAIPVVVQFKDTAATARLTIAIQ
jgi:uncharacterized protein (TIGR03437 family)